MAFTFFFRDRHTLEQLTKQMAPRVEGYDKIKVWDAGCAMGPEPYTFGIIMAEYFGNHEYKKIHIDATDIDETSNFKETVENGIYPLSDLSRMPENILEKYFSNYDGDKKYKINDLILNSVKFAKHDLLTLNPYDNKYNVILCKNVLLHFQYEERVNVYKMFHNVLEPKGLLCTEQTQPLPKEVSHLFKKIVTDANIFEKVQ